jgi:hypothetical protein
MVEFVSLVKAWSYSRHEVYVLCPLKFKLRYIDKLPEPGAPAMDRGTKVHAGAAAYLHGTGALPVEFVHAKHVQLAAELLAFPDKQVEQQWGYTRAWQPTGWFGNATWFRSILDVGVLYDDMTYEDIDWKTGKRYGSNAEQMETQALAVMCRLKPVTHVSTRLVYLDTGEEEFAEFPARDKEKLMRKWEVKVAPMFADDMFAPRPNDKCKWCAFSRSNWAGEGRPCKFG